MFHIIIASLLCLTLAHAGEVKVAWNPSARASWYEVWRLEGNSRTRLTTTLNTQATIEVSDGDELAVTALNIYGESGFSNSLLFELQESTDLIDWSRVAAANPRGPIYFTRFKVTTP